MFARDTPAVRADDGDEGLDSEFGGRLEFHSSVELDIYQVIRTMAISWQMINGSGKSYKQGRIVPRKLSGEKGEWAREI